MTEQPASRSEDQPEAEPVGVYTGDSVHNSTVDPDNIYQDSVYALLASAGTLVTGASVVAKAAIEQRAGIRRAEIEAETARLETAAENERVRIREAAETERERIRQQNPPSAEN